MNPLRGDSHLKVGDVTYLLCLDVNALCFAEKELSQTTDEILGVAASDFSGWQRVAAAAKTGVDLPTPRTNAVLIRALLWAALQKHNPGTHLVEAGEIMTNAGLGPTVIAVLDALFTAFGLAEDKDSAGPQKPPAAKKAGTGSISSRSGAKPVSSRTRSGGKRPG